VGLFYTGTPPDPHMGGGDLGKLAVNKAVNKRQLRQAMSLAYTRTMRNINILGHDCTANQ